MNENTSALGPTFDQVLADEAASAPVKGQDSKAPGKTPPKGETKGKTADAGASKAPVKGETKGKTADAGASKTPKMGKVFSYPGKVEGDCIRVYTYAILTALVGLAAGKPFRIVDFRQFWASPTAYTYLSGKGVFEPGNAPGTIVLTRAGVEFVKGRVIPKYESQCQTMIAYIRDGKPLSESVKVNTGAFYRDVKPQEMTYTPMG